MSDNIDSSESFFQTSDLGLPEGVKVAKVVFKVGKIAYKAYKRWDDEQKEQLFKTATTLLTQGSYEEALLPLRQLVQKTPENKGLWLYWSAECYRKLGRRDEALYACNEAINSSSDDELNRQIYILKGKIVFGFNFWCQWALATIISGVVSFLGTVILFGDHLNGGIAVLFAFLSIGISIGLAQWFLMHLRSDVTTLNLAFNIIVVIISLAAAILASYVNNWLGLAVFTGLTVGFTRLSINNSVKNLRSAT